MARLRSLVTFATVVCSLLALPAYARFGKSGSDGDSNRSHGSSHDSGNHVHAASPNTSRGSVTVSPGAGSWAYRPSGRSYWSGAARGSCWNCGGYYGGNYGWGYRPLWWGAPMASGPAAVMTGPAQMEAEPEAPLFTFSATGQGFLNTGGGSISGTAGYEQARFGLMTEFNALAVPADDGSGATDHLRLWNSYATYTLLSGDRGRLRVGGGVNVAFAPDAAFVGPGILAQASVGLFGPVGLEGTVQVTPLPFVQVDWSAGATVAIGQVALRGGWRRIYLNDQGALDGVIHEDVFAGPYLGVALAL